MALRAARLVDMGLKDYRRALGLMRDLAAAKRSRRLPEVVLMGRHPPVVTLGRRASAGELKAPPEVLSARGVEVVSIERGGLATFHGPHQLVVYPIFDLARLGLGVAELVNRLEQAVIDTLNELGFSAAQSDQGRGVWLGEAKVAFIGLAVKGGISLHGLSLNVGLDLAGWELIVPCGLSQTPITSLARASGRAWRMGQVARPLTRHLARRFDLDLMPWTWRQARQATAGRDPDQA